MGWSRRQQVEVSLDLTSRSKLLYRPIHPLEPWPRSSWLSRAQQARLTRTPRPPRQRPARTNTLGSLRLDSFVFTLSVWRYLYIWIHRVKLFKYLELGQNRFLALVLILVLRHSLHVDINLIYLTPHCWVIHFKELVRIASTLPLRAPTFSCIQISVCYVLLQSIYATLNFFFSQSAKRKCAKEDGFLCQPTMSSVAVRKESAQ